MLGYPGSGKTTAAVAVEQVTGATHLWADQIRRQMFGNPTYAPAENAQLYEELNRQTETLLQTGKSVVFDTSFNYFADRQHLREIAAKHGANTALLWVKTPKEIAQQRATSNAESQPTRTLGNMAHTDFERLSGKLEEPGPNEPFITLDGTKITPDYVADLLH